ncbi:MAG TPA: zinc ABC transporter substrate-binding protein [Paenirhodobacter sp.]
MRSSVILSLALCATPALTWAEVPKVVTNMPVVQSLAAQVMGTLGRPDVLLDRGADPHSYQMKPSQARALQNADLLLWVGPEMTPWLQRAIEAAGNVHQIALLHSQGTHQQNFIDDDDDDAHDHDHDHGAETHDEDHEPAHEHDADGHSHEGLDPHAWLDPHNAENWVDIIAGALSKADPANAATYAANAKAAQARIETLDQDLQILLAPVQDHPFIVYHAAYGYFAQHYGLADQGSVAFGDATDPGAAHLSELRTDLNQKNVICAFPESGHDPRPMERLIDGTQVRLGKALDPEGLALASGPDLYDTLMRDIGGNLADCLNGQ